MSTTKKFHRQKSALGEGGAREFKRYVEQRFVDQLVALGRTLVNRYVLGEFGSGGEGGFHHDRRDALYRQFRRIVDEAALQIELGSQGRVYVPEGTRTDIARHFAFEFEGAVRAGRLDRYLTQGTIDRLRQLRDQHAAMLRARRVKHRALTEGLHAARTRGDVAEATRFDRRLDSHYKHGPESGVDSIATEAAFDRLFGHAWRD